MVADVDAVTLTASAATRAASVAFCEISRIDAPISSLPADTVSTLRETSSAAADTACACAEVSSADAAICAGGAGHLLGRAGQRGGRALDGGDGLRSRAMAVSSARPIRPGSSREVRPVRAGQVAVGEPVAHVGDLASATARSCGRPARRCQGARIRPATSMTIDDGPAGLVTRLRRLGVLGRVGGLGGRPGGDVRVDLAPAAAASRCRGSSPRPGQCVALAGRQQLVLRDVGVGVPGRSAARRSGRRRRPACCRGRRSSRSVKACRSVSNAVGELRPPTRPAATAPGSRRRPGPASRRP